MKKYDIILVGGFHEIIELCLICNSNIIGIIDNFKRKDYCGYEILGHDKDASRIFKDYPDTKVIITPDEPKIREALYKYYSAIGFKFATLVHPGAYISPMAVIGDGTIIHNYVNVSPEVKIGRCVRLNTFSNIMHNSKIHDFVTIAPNAVILGEVEIEESAYIGSNSTLLPKTRIGKNAIIGAGSVVTKNIKDNTTVIGNPAKELIKNN